MYAITSDDADTEELGPGLEKPIDGMPGPDSKGPVKYELECVDDDEKLLRLGEVRSSSCGDNSGL